MLSGRLSHRLYRSSEGRLVLSNKSRVVNVTIPKNLADQTSCSLGTKAKDAQDAVVEQWGLDPSEFSFREYID